MNALKWIQKLFKTDRNLESLIIRVTLAAVMFPHGAQKLFGWFGGYGFEGTMGFLTGQIGLPAWIAAIVILTESIGMLALITGLWTRVTSFFLIAVMVGAIVTTHASNGFFMNWYGAQAGEGFEYHLLVIGMALALLIKGAGRYALDTVIYRAWSHQDQS